MSGCECAEPLQSPNPRSRSSCAKCGRRFDPAVLSSDENHARFFDALEDAIDRGDLELFQHFRREALQRERGGREHFGVSHLTRSNPREGCDEGLDLGNYGLFSMLQRLREAGDEDGKPLALTAAMYGFLAYKAFCELESRWRGSP